MTFLSIPEIMSQNFLSKKEDVGLPNIETGLLGHQEKKYFPGEFSHRRSKRAAYQCN
jgi:hypothetical protein